MKTFQDIKIGTFFTYRDCIYVKISNFLSFNFITKKQERFYNLMPIHDIKAELHTFEE